MKTISFILPVYNVENYLKETFYSIYSQTDERCEIILIDDGSTDASPAIVDELGRLDNVKIMHKENGGPSLARNIGLSMAEGKYVTFVDSDDRLAKGSVKRLLNLIDSAGIDIDLIFMQAIKFYPDGTSERIGDGITCSGIRNKTKAQLVEYIASRPKFPGSACTKVYLKDFLVKNGILFPDDGMLSEDLGFARDCIMLAERYAVLDSPYYEYRQRNNSRSSSSNVKAVTSILKFIRETLRKYPVTMERMYNFNVVSFCAYEYSVCLLNYALLEKEEKSKLKKDMDRYKWVLSCSKTKYGRIINIMVRFLGVDLTAKCVKYVYMKRK